MFYVRRASPLHAARALDVAATLEVRGYATVTAAGGPRRLREPWSRHDHAFAASAVGLVELAAGARLLGYAGFDAYPRGATRGGRAEAALARRWPTCARCRARRSRWVTRARARRRRCGSRPRP